MFKLRLPSPAMVIACVALLVSMSGTAIAASPVVKRALFANNAGKLQGKSAVEVAGLPGPASTAAGLLSTRRPRTRLAPTPVVNSRSAATPVRRSSPGASDDGLFSPSTPVRRARRRGGSSSGT